MPCDLAPGSGLAEVRGNLANKSLKKDLEELDPQKLIEGLPAASSPAIPVLAESGPVLVTTAAADASSDPDESLPGLPPIAAAPSRRRPEMRRWELAQFAFTVCQLALDLGAMLVGFWLSYAVRKRIDFGGPFVDFNPSNYLLILLISTGSVLLAFNVQGLYRLKRGYSKIDEFYRVCAATGLGLVLAVFLNSFIIGPNFQYSRIILGYSAVLIIALTLVERWIFGWLVALLRRLGVAQVRILIVGVGDPTTRIVRRVQANPDLGYKVVGVICGQPQSEHECQVSEGVPLLGHIADLPQLVRSHRADELIIAVSDATQEELYDLVGLCDDLPVNIRIYPQVFQLITANEVSISALTGLPLVSVKDVALRGVNRVIKRTMDVFISALVLILVSPLMIIIALLIKLTDPRGPVFYAQARVGLDNKPFTVLKFRSMRFNAGLPDAGWTVANDPRRTRFGRFIRRYSLDELPQFINVLLGDMSMVGPRPEQPEFVEEFSRTIPRYLRRHQEKAGITGWAQVNGLRGDTSIAERTRYDLYYVENWSVLFDLKIMLKTIIVIFTDKNAY